MATHATLAYCGEDYVAKQVHYGLYDDVRFYLKNATPKDIVESVNKGNSTSLFAGFYSNEEYCKQKLNWPQSIIDQTDWKPETFSDLTALIKSNPYVYLLTKDGNVTVYKNGKRLHTIDLSKGDGRGAIRDRVEVEFMRKGFGVWMTPSVFQHLSFDKGRTSNKPDLYILSDNILIKTTVERELNVSEFVV